MGKYSPLECALFIFSLIILLAAIILSYMLGYLVYEKQMDTSPQEKEISKNISKIMEKYFYTTRRSADSFSTHRSATSDMNVTSSQTGSVSGVTEAGDTGNKTLLKCKCSVCNNTPTEPEMSDDALDYSDDESDDEPASNSGSSDYSMAVSILTQNASTYVCTGVVVASDKVLTGECLLAAPNGTKWTDLKVRSKSKVWSQLTGKDYKIKKEFQPKFKFSGLHLLQTKTVIEDVSTAQFSSKTNKEWLHGVGIGWEADKQDMTERKIEKSSLECLNDDCDIEWPCDLAEVGHILLDESSKNILGISTGRGCQVAKLDITKGDKNIHWTDIFNELYTPWLKEKGITIN